ncbi:hypothetical protein MMC13_003842 [Lambiella insularis]|nr:hypothetical protein [Lambiella insularis]
MPVEEAPDDEDIRQTFNFAPGNYGLVYRADVPDYGAGPRHANSEDGDEAIGQRADPIEGTGKVRYKLQAMKWGLVPFWTKRNPDYGTVMKTINARDDSLAENRGMWNTMKQKKRCIVIAQGFFEWLKKNGGKEKIPHYIRRKDGQLMCFAGLWDCVHFEESEEKLYTYTIITTDSNKQLKFLHDRMPVVLENGSEQIRTWLDPERYEWSKDLQQMLKPFDGELECYAVSKEVGKVGNNSPDFIVPVSSSDNKKNIANFFANAKAPAGKGRQGMEQISSRVKPEASMPDDDRPTVDIPRTEDNAPTPMDSIPSRVKREREEDPDVAHSVQSENELSSKKPRIGFTPSKGNGSHSETNDTGRSKRKTRSATSNGSTLKTSPPKTSDGSQRITDFFNK